MPGYAGQLRSLFPARVVFDGGVWGQSSAEISARQLRDSQRTTWINVFWLGRNNFGAPRQVLADIAASVAHLAAGNTRFIVLSVLNAEGEIAGSAAHRTITDLNASLAAAYPSNYIDVRRLLVQARNTGNVQDTADFENDVVPSSLRADGIHLNQQGNRLVAQRVKAFMDTMGW